LERKAEPLIFEQLSVKYVFRVVSAWPARPENEKTPDWLEPRGGLPKTLVLHFIHQFAVN